MYRKQSSWLVSERKKKKKTKSEFSTDTQCLFVMGEKDNKCPPKITETCLILQTVTEKQTNSMDFRSN